MADNRVVVKGALNERNELSPVTQRKHKEAMKKSKRFSGCDFRREVIDETDLRCDRFRIAARAI
jgi:hypothetical protein